MSYSLRLIAGILGAVVAIHLGAGPAGAEKRVALVIGNSAYQHTRALPNPKSDAEAIAKLLADNGFAEVALKVDLDYRTMRETVRRFTDASLGADVALVYYAGHGLEVAGENYLVPVDAKLLRDVDLEYEAVTLASLLTAVDGAHKLKLVILDACRNNPLGEKMAVRAGRTRSVPRGLARLEATGEVLVAYSAKAGTVAQDGAGRHSPYAEALLKHMPTPGLDVLRMFGRVKEAVLAATQGGQEPWIYGSPSGEAFALVPTKAAGLADTRPVAIPQPQPSSDAAQAWALAKDSTSIPVLEAFRRQYGAVNAFYDRLAEARIEELRRQQLALLKAQEDRKRAEADLSRPGRVFRDCPDCPEMVVVPAGSFVMGSPPGDKDRMNNEFPQHQVTIARPFAVGKYEVTFDEWDACEAERGCNYRPGDQAMGRGRRPVINVSWDDITKQYLPWLSRKTGKTYRLLSDSEWEYAARAGTTARYGFGDTISNSQAQYSASSTATVGSFLPNAFGLYEMYGNVWEWVQDCWNDTYDGAPADGSAWSTGKCNRRVIRGGGYNEGPMFLRRSVRNEMQTDSRFYAAGFRLGRTL